MQTANVTVVVDPNHKLPKRGVTPAECLILAAMHRKNSNGMPLEDLVVQQGEAVTIEIPAKAAVAGYFDQGSGRHVDPVKAKPAVTHKRTQSEEIERLRRTYHGNIDNKPAFEAVFGGQARVTLPETFDEISAELGVAAQTETLPANALSMSGPTFEEYTAAGYAPESYPPSGYMAKASDGWTAELERRKSEKKPAAPEGEKGEGEPAPNAPTEAGTKKEDEAALSSLPAEPPVNRPRPTGGNRQQRNP